MYRRCRMLLFWICDLSPNLSRQKTRSFAPHDLFGKVQLGQQVCIWILVLWWRTDPTLSVDVWWSSTRVQTTSASATTSAIKTSTLTTTPIYLQNDQQPPPLEEKKRMKKGCCELITKQKSHKKKERACGCLPLNDTKNKTPPKHSKKHDPFPQNLLLDQIILTFFNQIFYWNTKRIILAVKNFGIVFSL